MRRGSSARRDGSSNTCVPPKPSPEAIRIAETVNQPFSLTIAYHGAGVLSLRQGDLSTAIPLLERGLGLCQAGSVSHVFAALAVALGVAYALCGRVAETLPLLEHVAGPSTSIRWPQYVSPFLWVGEASLLAGCLEDAMLLACRALEHACARKERGYQAHALWLRGEIAMHHEPPMVEQAEHDYRQALALAEELGMRPLLAHCHRGLGILCGRMGRRAQTRAALSTAIELYRALGMTFWLSRAETALTQMA